MIFSKKRSQKKLEKKFKININNYGIKQVSEMKYLGVILDNKLNWHDHIQYVSTKLSKAAGIIFKFKRKMPQNVLMLLYHSLVATYLRYGIASWGAAKTSALAKLQCLQNKVVCCITQHTLLLQEIFLPNTLNWIYLELMNYTFLKLVNSCTAIINNCCLHHLHNTSIL